MSADKSDLILPAERAERVARYQPPQLAPGKDAATIMQIVERMIREATFDPVAIREMLAIKKEYEADEARKAYMEAMAAFKENAPTFFKTKHVDYGSGKAKFDYAPIAEVVSKIVPALAAHGLTHNWIPKVSDGMITVRCVLTHRLGHSESIESPPVPPNSNGAMSVSQNVQATITFWQRMTLQSITGTAAGDMPDADDLKTEASDRITEKQAADIRALLTEVNATEESFLRVIKAPSIESIAAASYPMVVGLLEAKRRAPGTDHG
jgi:ERF superfamily